MNMYARFFVFFVQMDMATGWSEVILATIRSPPSLSPSRTRVHAGTPETNTVTSAGAVGIWIISICRCDTHTDSIRDLRHRILSLFLSSSHGYVSTALPLRRSGHSSALPTPSGGSLAPNIAR